MGEAALASRDCGHSEQEQQYVSNPFATLDANLAADPRSHQQRPSCTQGWQEAAANTHATTAHEKPSLSSSGSSMMTPMSSIDSEKRSLPKSHRADPTQRDLEKATVEARNITNQPSFTGDSTSVAYSDGDDPEVDNGRLLQERKAVKILLFLSGPCVILSSLNAVWCFISLVISLLTQPFRLCARRPTFGQQLAALLGPTLRLQLRCIYTPLTPHANQDGPYHSVMLVMVHVISPFVSLGIMLAAWVLAVYWVSSAVVGDPAGKDNRDDGRETVLGLRRWWERWLKRSVAEH